MADPVVGRFVVVEGRRVHVLEAGGKGPPVVLLHGCGSLAEEVLASFRGTPHPYRFIAVDRPGYGYSDPLPAGREGPDHQAGWLGRVLDALGLPSAILVAHSLGAPPALWFAAGAPRRVAGLLLIAPYCRPTQPAAQVLLRLAALPRFGRPIRERLLPRLAVPLGRSMMARALSPNPVPDYLEDFPFRHAGHPGAVMTMAAELKAFGASMGAFAGRRPRLDMPIEIVHGAADVVAEPGWHLPWLLAQLGRPEATLLDGIGHNPHHASPAAIRAAIDRLAAA